MAAPDLVILSRRVVTGEGIRPAAVAIADGVITAVHEHGGPPDAARQLDVGDAALLPGVVDTHVHVNEPGRTDWEGLETATRAAAAGGVTTIVDMPLNSIPVTTTVESLEQKGRAAAGHATVDYAFWGGVVPGNTAQLAPLAEAGVAGFKCFLVASGIDEFPSVSAADLYPAMTRLAELGLPLLVHAELPALPPAHGATPVGSPHVPPRPSGKRSTWSSGCAARRDVTSTSCISRPPPHWTGCGTRGGRVFRSRSRPARIISRSPPRTSRTALRSGSVLRRSASGKTASACGAGSPM